MLAIVAGEGELPGLVFETLDGSGQTFHLAELEGHPCDARAGRPVIRFRIETLGSFINTLVDKGVDRICFAGRVARPPLDPGKIDPATMPLVPRMMAALQQGDDAALRTLLNFFDEAGITPVGAHEIRPDLLPAAGVLTEKQPEPHHEKDVARGAEIIAAMGQADVGQACIVAGGQALALEAAPGTDWMMQSLMAQNVPLRGDIVAGLVGYGGTLQRPQWLPPGGVLVKAAKPLQELRVDMPTIGPDTLRRASQVGLDGVVIEAGRVMVLDAPRCIKIADQQGLFLWVKA